MDYEKKYNEALERAKTLFESQESSPGRKKWLSDVFPELRESEDERIRKALIKAFRDCNREDEFCGTGFTYPQIIAHLEKTNKIISWRSPNDCGDIPDGHYVVIEYHPGIIGLGYVDSGKVVCAPGKTPRAILYIPNMSESVVFDKILADEVTQDYSGLTDLERAIHRGFLCAGVENVPVGIIKETAQECHVQIKTAEHAENIGPLLELKTLYGHILEGDFTRKKPIYSQNEIIRRLVGLDETIKSIRTPWRPTDAQMDALDNIASSFSPNNKEYDMVMENINSLREDLLKLKFPKS